jgi:hypothetical protein
MRIADYGLRNKQSRFYLDYESQIVDLQYFVYKSAIRNPQSAILYSFSVLDGCAFFKRDKRFFE